MNNIVRGPIPGSSTATPAVVRGPIPGGSKIIKSPTHAPLPAHLVEPMRLFRLDLSGLPMDFLVWHEDLAQEEAQRLRVAYGLAIYACRTVSDGWCDGMRVIELVTETRAGKLLKLQWHPGNQGFMVDTGHGHAAMFESDLV